VSFVVKMDLSIVIVNWNTHELLAQCLQSIAENVRTCERVNVETFVVDNASTDGSAAMVRERFPWVRLIENAENVGFARANNQAFAQSQGQYLMLLNSDAQLLPGVLASLFIFMEQHPAVGMVGPEIINGQGKVQFSWAQFPTFWTELWGRHLRKRTVLSDNVYAVDWLAGACLFVRRAVLEQVGPLDARFFLYSEETDWCKRIAAAGWQVVYYPAVRVLHHEGSSSIQEREYSYFLLHHSKLLYAEKYFGRASALALKISFIGLAVLKAVVRLLTGDVPAARVLLRFARALWRDGTLHHG
jgi:hypothetical protein